MGRNKKNKTKYTLEQAPASQSGSAATGGTCVVSSCIPRDACSSISVPCTLTSKMKGAPLNSDQCRVLQSKKKKKASAPPTHDDVALQELVDFIEGNDADKENVATAVSSQKKAKKKKRKKDKGTAPPSSDSKTPNPTPNETNDDIAKKIGARKEIKEECKESSTKEGTKKAAKPSSGKQEAITQRDSNKPDVKPVSKSKSTYKSSKKGQKEPTQEDLEIAQIVKFIEGTNLDETSDRNNNENENPSKRSKPKKKKNKKKKSQSSESEAEAPETESFNFNELENSAVLTPQMLGIIIRNPPCVADFRIFNPKQVALLFSSGHNEHWNEFPECKGRLKALEKSTEGFTLYDPGCKQLKLIIDELKRSIKGRPITKADMIQGLQCHAYLKCSECGYCSEVVILNNV